MGRVTSRISRKSNPLLIRMPRHAAKRLRKRLGITVFAPRADLGAAANGIPSRIRPLNSGMIAHGLRPPAPIDTTVHYMAHLQIRRREIAQRTTAWVGEGDSSGERSPDEECLGACGPSANPGVPARLPSAPSAGWRHYSILISSFTKQPQ